MKTNRGVKSLKPDSEQIAIAAYHLYIERGGGDGHDLDDWLRAEELLCKRMAEEAGTRMSAAPVPAPPSSQTILENQARPSDSNRSERRSAARGETRKQTASVRPAARAQP